MTDKRKHERVLANIKIKVRVEFSMDELMPLGKVLECQTRDLSLAGICIYCNEPISPRTRLLVALEIDPPDEIYNHHTQVVWCRKSEDGYLVGLRTLEYLCDEAEWKNVVLKFLVG